MTLGIPGGRFRHKIVEFLTKKPYRDHIRSPNTQAPRSIPKPVMPASENSAVSSNYYYSRDLRREVHPPVSILDKQITAGEETSALPFSAPTAGNIYNPGEIPYQYGLSLNDRLGDVGYGRF